ncbi:MAG: hypothetical protein MJ188_10085 [Treponema sp.]|nr:hypothetical protein [Treponema sp.]
MEDFIKKIDEKATAKGKGVLLLWQILKFLVVSCMATIIQLVLVNVLHNSMKNITTPITGFLAKIFTEQTMGVGNTTWGYILPWFLSNLIANIYGYIQNRITTFRSDSPWWCMVIYIFLLIALILFSTWLQGVIFNACTKVDITLVSKLAPTIAAMSAGTLQFVVLFPLQKYLFFKKTSRE